ncbi:uncharacterized protein LOC131884723 [Tigriopus californicus]|uniref:uncharacterized protein LOC131884723 n=1 Tax=Tigriopus californicus TaxID=6832 RepID=UPI0027DA0FDA|nr:uncharacterized protein LOC131884723 [Tigriopus californicus]
MVDWRYISSLYNLDSIWVSRLFMGVPLALLVLLVMWLKFASMVRNGYFTEDPPTITVEEAYLDAMLNDEFEIIDPIEECDSSDETLVTESDGSAKRALNTPSSKNELNASPTSKMEPKKDI